MILTQRRLDIATSAAFIAAIMLVPQFLDEFWLNRMAKFLVYGMLGVAISLSWGYAGILNLGQGLFFGLGAYTYAIAVTNMGDSTVPFVLAIVLPAAFAAVLGYLIIYGRL
jgi:branched-chain amino acid transport system permease protein